MDTPPNIFPDAPFTTPGAMPSPPPPPPPRRRPGCLIGLLGGCLLSALLLVGSFASLIFGGAYVFHKLANSPTLEHLCAAYEFIQGNDDCPKQVLRLELNGVITGAAPSRWYLPPDCDAAVLAEIEQAIEEESIDGLLLVVDSPGGSVTASDELYYALERFKAAKDGRKVVVLGRDMLASGAYYFAMAADWIRLQPTGLVGSIGVIVPGVNLYGLATKVGVVDNSIASGANKDLGNPLKPVNAAHNARLQSLVNGLHARFIALVAQGRKMTADTVRPLADGSIYLAQDAVNLRLIDDTGYEQTLPATFAKLFDCAEEEIALFRPAEQKPGLRAFLSDFPGALGRGIAAPLLEAPAARPALLYR
ncbi:MAG: signal peptide peptidase SppA [Candidatus Spyradenecus sp.]